MKRGDGPRTVAASFSPGVYNWDRMAFGRDMPGKDARAQWARQYVAARSPYALAAGLLGAVAPIDGLIFFPLSIAAMVVAVVGWLHLNRNPRLLGRGLCAAGFTGGLIGLTLFIALRAWDGPAANGPARQPEIAPSQG